MAHVGRGGDRIQKVSDKFQAADLRRHIFFPQALLQSDQIYRFSLIIKFQHGVEKDTILALVKIFTCNDFRGCHDRIPVHDHGTDDGLLSLHAMGQNPFDQRFFHSLKPLLHEPSAQQLPSGEA